MDRATPVREIRVALEADPDTRDGWRAYGGRRLRVALNHWNGVSLPVRLVPARTLREADIIVEVITAFPRGEDAHAGQRYRAGQTRLTWAADGEITGAHVLIAEQTPFGEHYSVADQSATLLHELGHALGLPHVANPGALMATRTRVDGVTPVDVTLARSVYSPRGCPGVRLAANDDSPGIR